MHRKAGKAGREGIVVGAEAEVEAVGHPERRHIHMDIQT